MSDIRTHFIKIVSAPELVYAKASITRNDLADVAMRSAILIDVEHGTCFDAENNKWVPLTEA